MTGAADQKIGAGPPSITSSPPPPTRASLPAKPCMKSLPSVPATASLAFVPIHCHCRKSTGPA
ncbi:hypothetical protein D3867_35745 (plasmid) [Azospirillum argentinense]|uniref:Uncharacterized protein n=1 Tax=Azospirillum brasilense TaxID=192 RepID=A0A4D8QGC2_AZOBR|nr:hypothetical protein D3867_35745 [Azospirillum argentinense]